MENRTVLVDTSILIDFLRKERKDKTILWQLREQSPCTIGTRYFGCKAF
jgi:predicted nucleic acid-binding protein